MTRRCCAAATGSCTRAAAQSEAGRTRASARASRESMPTPRSSVRMARSFRRLYWENGIPPFVKGPIYDQTYQSGFANGTGAGGAVTYGEPEQPTASLSELEPLDPALAHSFVGLDCGLRGKQRQTACAAAGRGIWSNQMDPRYLVLGNLLNQTATPANIAAAAGHCSGSQTAVPHFLGNNRSDAYGHSRSITVSPILTAMSVNRTTTPCRLPSSSAFQAG